MACVFGLIGRGKEGKNGDQALLHAKEVVSDDVCSQIQGLGGFRNILVHRHLDIDPREILLNHKKGLVIFARLAQEIQD